MSLTAFAVVDGTPEESGADNDTENDLWTQLSIEQSRALISKVPGSGAVRGVHVYRSDIYAFRDNDAATACIMFKATSDGWIEQTFGYRVAFTLGTDEFLEGETLSQTGTTATIVRVVKQSGTWAGNDAAGYLVISNIKNRPYMAGTVTSDSGSATLSGEEVEITIAPGGRFEFRNFNFYATTVTQRMYGVSGVDYAFEWDGTNYVPVITGNTVDTPHHLEIYKLHLFLAFANGSLQNSVPGEPIEFDGALGAAEIGIGDDITGLQREVGNSLAILSRNRTQMLYGSLAADFDLRSIDEESGAIEWTIQRIGRTRYIDDRGFTDLKSVQAFGDFKSAVYSQLIEPLVEANKSKVTASLISKTKNQYRVFFNDGTAIYATFDGNKIKGFMTQSLLDNTGNPMIVNVATNGEDANGNEIIFAGATDGYVYQIDKGTSFDGYQVEAFIVLSYVHINSPEYIKDFLKMVMEVSATSTISIYMTPDFDYSDREDIQQIITTLSGGGRWNVAKWNQFLWSSPGVGNPEAYIDGAGKNISVLVYTEETYAAPHTLHGMTLHYMFRRRSR